VVEAVAALEEEDACTMQLILVRLLGLSEPAVVDEVFTEPLTPARFRELRARSPGALPEADWCSVEETLAPSV
jgi:hypothetical protein